LLNAPVLVLNQNYEPLNVCDIRRAFNLLGAEKAELLERNHQVIHTPTLAIPAPRSCQTCWTAIFKASRCQSTEPAV